MRNPKDLARQMLMRGLALIVAGTLVAALAAPDGAILFGPLYRSGHGDGGNAFFFVVGAVAAWVGYVMITIWTIAQGVALGNKLGRQ
jgi:hypothetical protein